MEVSLNGLFSLVGKVAIVTGGNGGIGEGIAQGLAAAGAHLVIAARNKARTEDAAARIKKRYHTEVLGVQTDVSQEDEIIQMVAACVKHFDKVDILVANAGMAVHKLPQAMSVTEWDDNLDTNLRGVFICAKAVYPIMKSIGGGKIITIGSLTSIFGVGDIPAYGASKGGVLQLSRSLAVAWARDKIQVNCLLPGWVNTDLSAGGKKQIPALEQRVIDRTPAGRWGEPLDLAAAAIFLAGPGSDFVTGVALPVDGGYAVMG